MVCIKSKDDFNIRQLFEMPQLIEKVSGDKNDLYQFENN